MKLSLSSLLILLYAISAPAQINDNRKSERFITGKVFDFNAGVPVEYANILLLNQKDSTQAGGTVTGKNGVFSISGIKDGIYLVNVRFIGYESKVIRNLAVSSSKNKIDLGNIYLKQAAINLQNVIVQGERSPVTYKIDKKVIDVSQIQTAVSGNVADILENIPSVTVDIDGTVSLRGSSNFTVLIDGRPTVMDAQDALQQIPASSIQNLEIITNPSAKYDPEGNSGIINIIMKKNKNYGLSGIVNANVGIDNKYGGDFLFEQKNSAVNYNLGMDYNRRSYPGTSNEARQFFYEDNTSFVNSDGIRDHGRISFGLRGGADFNLSESDILGFGGRYGTRDHIENNVLNYNEWSSQDPLNYSYLSRNEGNRTGSFYALHSNYLHKFNMTGHELSLDIFFGHNNADESNISSDIVNQIQIDGKKTTESGPSSRLRGKIEYTLPLSASGKFEAGSQGEMRLSRDITKLYQFDAQTGIYDNQQDYNNDIDYDISSLAVYSIYSDDWGGFGIQGGARGEYTFRTIDLTGTNQKFSIDRWDFFPTVHTSYKFSEATQMMLSYTRRIDRPHGWSLEPFYSWTDANNVRIGNPSLQPEFIDSYDYGFQTYFGGLSFSNDFYYRINHNKIEHIRSVYAPNVTLTTFDNVGTDYSLGSEFMITYDPAKVWNINLMGNLYKYKIDGAVLNQSFARESFNWSTRISNGFKLTASTTLQLNVRYNSPTVSSQGKREGFFMTDLAVKQELFRKVLSFTLQIRDLLGTGKYDFYSQGTGLTTHTIFKRQSPVVMLNVKYNFNNYKNENRPENDQPDSGFGGEEM